MLQSMRLKESDITEQLNNNNKYNCQIIIKKKNLHRNEKQVVFQKCCNSPHPVHNQWMLLPSQVYPGELSMIGPSDSPILFNHLVTEGESESHPFDCKALLTIQDTSGCLLLVQIYRKYVTIFSGSATTELKGKSSSLIYPLESLINQFNLKILIWSF